MSESEPAPLALAPPSPESLLAAVNVLPASPQILARLHPLLVRVDVSIDDVTELLRCDSALTARIIRIANSVAYNPGEPLGSIEEALIRIGLSEVYRITGFAVLAQVSSQQIPLYDITAAQFRENALLTALIVEELAHAGAGDARAAYTAGLLRSTGKIALDRAARGGRRGSVPEPYAHGPLGEWEAATFGCGNGDAAGLVLEAWRFPHAMVEAVRFHYSCPLESTPLTRLLNLAAGAAERCGHGMPGEYPYWDQVPEKCAAAGITEDVLDAATRRALESFGPVRVAIS